MREIALSSERPILSHRLQRRTRFSTTDTAGTRRMELVVGNDVNRVGVASRGVIWLRARRPSCVIERHPRDCVCRRRRHLEAIRGRSSAADAIAFIVVNRDKSAYRRGQVQSSRSHTGLDDVQRDYACLIGRTQKHFPELFWRVDQAFTAAVQSIVARPVPNNPHDWGFFRLVLYIGRWGFRLPSTPIRTTAERFRLKHVFDQRLHMLQAPRCKPFRQRLANGPIEDRTPVLPISR